MTTSLKPSLLSNWPLTKRVMNAPTAIDSPSGKPASTGSLTLCDTKPASKKCSSRSKICVSRQAWVLRVGTLYLQAIEQGTTQWTANAAGAMSWLDPDLAMQRLQMIPSLKKSLPASNLAFLTFTAEIGIHPLEWRHDP